MPARYERNDIRAALCQLNIIGNLGDKVTKRRWMVACNNADIVKFVAAPSAYYIFCQYILAQTRNIFLFKEWVDWFI